MQNKPAEDRYAQEFKSIVGNAKGEDQFEEITQWEDGRDQVGLYLVHGNKGEKKYVIGATDRWHKPPKYSIGQARYANAVSAAKDGSFLSEEKAIEYYRSANEPTMVDKIIDSIRGFMYSEDDE